MQKKALLAALIDINVIKLGEFTLRSGEISPIYIDLRTLISYPLLLRAVSHALWDCIKAVKPRLLCGVPYTALPLATCIALEQSLPMLMCRKEAKAYGTKKQVEGIFQPLENCLIIEDVITTGASVLKVADILVNEGLEVTDIAVLVDRQQGGREAIVAAGYRLHAVFSLDELYKK